MRPKPRYDVYLVTDRAACLGRDLLDVIRAAVAGGVTLVQLREKNLDTRGFVELAVAVKNLLSPLSVPLLINDRLDVALASRADGAHVGQDDMPAALARTLLGPDKVLGLSAHTFEETLAGNDADVDYFGVGPIFATATKPDAKNPIGVAGLAAVCSRVARPVVGIGGIDAVSAASVITAKAAGVAVVSAICSATDPKAAARAIAIAVAEAKKN